MYGHTVLGVPHGRLLETIPRARHVYVLEYYHLVRRLVPWLARRLLASELVRPRVALAYIEERSDPSSGPILKTSLACLEIENFLQRQVLGFSLREVVASALASALGSTP
jgi:hypothetical protein